MKKKSRSSRRRRIRRIKRIIALLVMAGIILVLFLVLKMHASNVYDTSFAYDLEQMNGAEAMTPFSLQTEDGFASELVASPSNVNTDQLALQEDGERALLFNLKSNDAVYGRGIYDQIYPASITKVMTALLAVKYGNMADVVVMQESDFALEDGAQTSDLQVGDQVTMDQLLHLMLVYSANDAAMAIARQVGGDTGTFVSMMNEEALSLGMTATHFINPHGLHDDNHYTSVYDIYLMMWAAYEYPAFSEASSMKSYEFTVTGADGQQRALYETSTDEYLDGTYSLPSGITIMASKTGTTNEAGSCLALVVQNGSGVPYIAVVTGASTKDILYGDMGSLLGLANGT
ncbi:MAG: serine hydrolase [Eubacterium sp.]|nr:serine hydrolase [Eubacterium sp.]